MKLLIINHSKTFNIILSYLDSKEKICYNKSDCFRIINHLSTMRLNIEDKIVPIITNIFETCKFYENLK